MKVVITIPAYNEENTIWKVIRGIKFVMNKTSYKYEILVINDGSSDKTEEIAKKEGAKVISHIRNKGLAETFKTEMQECLKLRADIIVHTDADGQYPSYYIPELIRKVEEGYGLVLGSRFERGKYSGSLMNNFGNRLFAKVFSRLLRIKLTDTTTGFRAFTKEVAGLQLINTFTYTQEQLIKARRLKMNIGEIPIKTRKTRKSKLFRNPFHYAIKAWINIFRIYRDFEPLRFFGLFGLIFLSLGFLIGLRLLYLFLSTGYVGHLPSVMLSSLLTIVGIQVILFGFLADMNKK